MKKYRIRKGSIAYYAQHAGEGLLFIAMLASMMFFLGCEYDKTAEREMNTAEVIEQVEITTNNYTYDVPLASELQLFIATTCEDYHIDNALVIAMISVESKYNANAIGDGGDSIGLMQIQSKWHAERMARLGVTDLTNPYENVTVGIDYLAEKLAEGQGIEWALMAYNGGNQYANEMTVAGKVSTYAMEVMAEAYKLTAERGEHNVF